MLPHNFMIHNNAASEVILLTGSPIAPTSVFVNTEFSDQTVDFLWTQDGRIEISSRNQGTMEPYSSKWSSSSPNVSREYWIRVNVNTGSDPFSINALNVWHTLDDSRGRLWFYYLNRNIVGSDSIKVEIASDPFGNNIEATGYYGLEYQGNQ